MIGLRPLAFALVLSLLAFPGLAQQRVYQWKDASGVTHYSDTRPNEAHTSRSINTRDGAAAPTTAAAPEESAQCKSVRSNLARLKTSEAIGIDGDGDGKPDRNLSADERKSQVELNEAGVKAYCPPAAQQ